MCFPVTTKHVSLAIPVTVEDAAVLDKQTNTQTHQFGLLLERFHTRIRRHILAFLDDWKSDSSSFPNLGQVLENLKSHFFNSLKRQEGGAEFGYETALKGDKLDQFEYWFGYPKLRHPSFVYVPGGSSNFWQAYRIHELQKLSTTE